MKFTSKKVVNIYVVYEIKLRSYTQSPDFTLRNSLFGTIKLTENVDGNNFSKKNNNIFQMTRVNHSMILFKSTD